MDLSIGTTTPVMVTQILAMFMMMTVGAVCYKVGFITKEGSRVLTNIACYVSTPAVIVRALATKFDLAIAANVAGVVVVTCVLMVVSIVMARVAYGIDCNRVAQLGIIVSNMGFVGIPLVEHVVGPDYVIYISAVIAAQVPFVWTYCVWLISGDAKNVSAKKVVTNPTIVSVVVGFAMFICSYELTGVLESFVDGVANLNTGVGMLLLGVFLAQSDIRSLVRTRSIYKASALRLLVVTGASAVLLAPLPMPVACKVVVLIAFAAPCGTVSCMFSQLFGGDYRYGAGLVTISTLLSLVSMPLMLMLGLALFSL